jgi:hypothetical protein
MLTAIDGEEEIEPMRLSPLYDNSTDISMCLASEFLDYWNKNNHDISWRLL